MAVNRLINETQGNDIIDRLNDIADNIQNIPYGLETSSDNVVAMTGYQKASTAGSISETDTLNEGIGKLEYKVNANQTNILSVEDMICDTDFSTSTAYAIGDIVTYNNSLYEFTSAHSAGAWNSADVTQIDIVGIIGNINTVLEGVL